RKTTKKNQKSLKNIFSYEVIGLLFILIAIFSSGANFFSDGFIPSILEYSLRFFLGMCYFIGSLVLFIMGLYLIFKNQYAKILTRNNISMVILYLYGLLLNHIYIIEAVLMVNDDKNIISITWENFVNYINVSSIGMKTAGGFTGAILLTLTFDLFSGI